MLMRCTGMFPYAPISNLLWKPKWVCMYSVNDFKLVRPKGRTTVVYYLLQFYSEEGDYGTLKPFVSKLYHCSWYSEPFLRSWTLFPDYHMGVVWVCIYQKLKAWPLLVFKVQKYGWLNHVVLFLFNSQSLLTFKTSLDALNTPMKIL